MCRPASRSAYEISDPLLVGRCWQVYARRFHSHEELLRGHLALQRERRGSETWRSALLAHASDLTEQEKAVCLRLLCGMSHAGTAAGLGIKETTVPQPRLPASGHPIFAASCSS